MDRDHRADAGDGRGARHRPRRPRLVRRRVGHDDGRDDAALHRPDGRGGTPGGRRPGRPPRAARRHRALRRRLPDRVDRLRPHRIRGVPVPRGAPPRLDRVGPRRARAGGRRRGGGGRVPADAAEARLPAPLPHAAPLRDAPVAPRRRGRRGHGDRARRVVRGVLRRPDARAVRRRGDEPVVDGARGRRDLRREGPALRRAPRRPGRRVPARARHRDRRRARPGGGRTGHRAGRWGWSSRRARRCPEARCSSPPRGSWTARHRGIVHGPGSATRGRPWPFT